MWSILVWASVFTIDFTGLPWQVQTQKMLASNKFEYKVTKDDYCKLEDRS